MILNNILKLKRKKIHGKNKNSDYKKTWQIYGEL